jgi:hypothetical protein
MKKSSVALAVGSILAAAAASNASANSYTIYVSGSSAARSFFESELGFVCSGSHTAPAKWTVLNSVAPGGLVPVAYPDIEAPQCTVTSLAGIPGGSSLTIGDVLTMQYAAELGSVWGIAPFIPGNQAANGREFLDVTNAAVCPASPGVCTVLAYSRQNDTASSGLAARVPIDIGVSDAEPPLWASPDNWPLTSASGLSYPVLGDAITQAQPTAAQLSTLASSFTQLNGQVFTVIVNNSAPLNTLTNLSSASLRSIFVGKYTNWGQVAEVGSAGSGTPITICRRDHGSGTQVTASLNYTGNECGQSVGTFVRLANGSVARALGSLKSNQVLENATTNDLTACVTSTTGAIGIRSLSAATTYTTLKIDGVEANAHNAASGVYPTGYDIQFHKGSTATGGNADLVTAILTDAQTIAALPAEGGSLSSGLVWSMGGAFNSQGGKANYGGQYDGGGSAKPSITSNWGITSSAPEALYNQAGTSCNIKINATAP